MRKKEYVFPMRDFPRNYIPILCFVLLLSLVSCASPTPLQRASRNGDLNTVRTLLESGVDVNERACWADHKGSEDGTALHAAAHSGHTDVIRLLIEKGANVNAKGAFGVTPLWEAIWMGQVGAIKLLLDSGADPRLADYEGNTAIDWAKNKTNKRLGSQILSMLEEAMDKRYGAAKKPALPISKAAPVRVKPDLTASTEKRPEFKGYEKPKVIITNPPIQRGISIIRQTSVTIRGRVEDAYGVDWVTINGQDAGLRSGGLFELTVNLADRDNKFIIRAMNKKGVTAEKIIALTRKVAALERPAAKPSLPNIFALLIGINNYHDERISDLKFAEQDAQAFYKFLIDPQRGAVSPKRVKLLVGDLASAPAIEQNLKRTLRASSPGDMVIIYMATHGVPDPEGGAELFFLSSNSNMDSLLKTSISKTDLEKMLSRYVSNRKIILISDACHAGGIGMSSQLLAFASRSIQQRTFRLLNKLATSHDGLGILSASRANELSQEDSKWGGGHGVFTYYLIRGLGGEADKSPSDGFVTLRELRDYLYDKVSASTSNLQTPELVGNYDPNLPIAIVR